MAIPDRTFAAVISHFKILRQFERVGRASVFAQATEHAARSIVGEGGQDLPARRIIAFPSHHDQVFGARQRTKIAADTKGFAGFGILIQPGGAAKTLCHHRPFQRILLRVDVFGELRPEGHAHSLQEIGLEDPLHKFFHSLSLFGQSQVVKDSCHGCFGALPR